MTRISLAVSIGSIGGWLALLAGIPMPFMLGAFLAAGIASLSGFRLFGVRPELPMGLRNLFVAVIGVMIGGSFRPGVFQSFTSLWLPLLGVGVFVLLAMGFNFLLFRKIGGYGRVTAFYAASPGGLIESIALGEAAGGRTQAIALQHFLRIALVISFLPFLFLLATGEKVGSAAGISLPGSSSAMNPTDILILVVSGLAGLYGGKLLRLPASILVGPLILSGLAHYLGLTSASPPGWAITVAQIIVGTGLGMRFSGFGAGEVAKAAGLAVISVGGMLLIAAALVFMLAPISGVPFQVLLIGFAPGGVTETSLIALSLNANPVFVTMLHVFRILLTVAVASVIGRLVLRRG